MCSHLVLLRLVFDIQRLDTRSCSLSCMHHYHLLSLSSMYWASRLIVWLGASPDAWFFSENLPSSNYSCLCAGRARMSGCPGAEVYMYHRVLRIFTYVIHSLFNRISHMGSDIARHSRLTFTGRLRVCRDWWHTKLRHFLCYEEISFTLGRGLCQFEWNCFFDIFWLFSQSVFVCYNDF